MLGEMEISSLVLMTRANDDLAFAEIVRRYTPMVRSVISGFDFPPSFAKEAESEACVALYRAAMSYDLSSDKVTFGLYARICVYRKLCDFAVKELSLEERMLDIDKVNLASSCTVESRLVRRESISGYLTRAREILSDYEYKVFELYLKGYTTRDIAGLLGKSAKSVDNAKNRMMRQLREHGSSFFD